MNGFFYLSFIFFIGAIIFQVIYNKEDKTLLQQGVITSSTYKDMMIACYTLGSISLLVTIRMWLKERYGTVDVQ